MATTVQNSSGFHNKYRPTSLDKIIGQTSTVSSLKGILDSGKWPSAIAFFGPPSAGKTTMAEALVSDALGGVAPDKSSDYTYINLADNRTIDDIRQMIQISKLSPLNGRRRFILADEAQGILSTPASCAAWLASLERPHSKMTWIVASMDPGKFQTSVNGKAILSRCTQYNLKPYTDAELGKQARRICKGEGIDYLSDEAIAEIIRGCNGEMRTIANSLQTISAYWDGLPKKERPKRLTPKELFAALETSIDDTEATSIRILGSVYAGKFTSAQKNIIGTQDGFGIVSKMLFFNYAVMNDAILNGARHPKVWITPGIRTLKATIAEQGVADRAKVVNYSSAIHSALVGLRSQLGTIAGVPDDMLISSWARTTIISLKKQG